MPTRWLWRQQTGKYVMESRMNIKKGASYIRLIQSTYWTLHTYYWLTVVTCVLYITFHCVKKRARLTSAHECRLPMATQFLRRSMNQIMRFLCLYSLAASTRKGKQNGIWQSRIHILTKRVFQWESSKTSMLNKSQRAWRYLRLIRNRSYKMISYTNAKYPRLMFFTITSCRFTKCSWNIHFPVFS